MHCVGVQVPLGVAPCQVMVPLYPVLHLHAGPAALLEFAMLHGAAVKLKGCVHMYVC